MRNYKLKRWEALTDNKLTPKQEKYLLALMTSKNVEEASTKAGIATATGYRYMKKDNFKEAQRNLMRGLMENVTGRLQYEATASINVLAELRDNPETPPYSRVEASKILLEMAFKSYELGDMYWNVSKPLKKYLRS